MDSIGGRALVGKSPLEAHFFLKIVLMEGAEKMENKFTEWWSLVMPESLKSKMRIAAAVMGVSMSEFARRAITELAEKTLKESGVFNGR